MTNNILKNSSQFLENFIIEEKNKIINFYNLYAKSLNDDSCTENTLYDDLTNCINMVKNNNANSLTYLLDLDVMHRYIMDNLEINDVEILALLIITIKTIILELSNDIDSDDD